MERLINPCLSCQISRLNCDDCELNYFRNLGTPEEFARLKSAFNSHENEVDNKDLVSVVRCGQCKHLRPSTETNRFYCSYKEEGEYWIQTYKDDFCSYGVRRKHEKAKG
jgi:hypothetical protein